SDQSPYRALSKTVGQTQKKLEITSTHILQKKRGHTCVKTQTKALLEKYIHIHTAYFSIALWVKGVQE
ncbi:hypothetical protein DVA76_19540, partial [Acinetobacter baumannii]